MNFEKELLNFLQGFKGHCECYSCEDEDDEECEICESIEKDYDGFIKWAFGDEESPIKKSKAKKIWKRLHPHLPLPRFMLTDEKIDDFQTSICLLMDCYHFYIVEKDEEEK
jgi:hypothetical protein